MTGALLRRRTALGAIPETSRTVAPGQPGVPMDVSPARASSTNRRSRDDDGPSLSTRPSAVPRGDPLTSGSQRSNERTINAACSSPTDSVVPRARLPLCRAPARTGELWGLGDLGAGLTPFLAFRYRARFAAAPVAATAHPGTTRRGFQCPQLLLVAQRRGVEDGKKLGPHRIPSGYAAHDPQRD